MRWKITSEIIGPETHLSRGHDQEIMEVFNHLDLREPFGASMGIPPAKKVKKKMGAYRMMHNRLRHGVAIRKSGNAANVCEFGEPARGDSPPFFRSFATKIGVFCSYESR